MAHSHVHEICCIGAGRVGVFSMLVLAHRFPNVRITVVDEDEDLINSWLGQNLPFHEPQLDEFINLYRGTRVHFGIDLDQCVGIADTIFLAIELTTKNYGLQDGRLDYEEWERMVLRIRDCAPVPKTVIDKSGVQFGVDNKLRFLLDATQEGIQHRIYSNPEFFSRGTAFQNLLNPDRVVIGTKSDFSIDVIMHLYNWVAPDRLIVVNHYNDAELGKLVSNVYLGLNGIIGNVMASLCEKNGGNIGNVMNVVQSDRRMEGIVSPHGAIGGPTLLRDLQYVAYLFEECNLKEQAQFLRLAIKLNKKMKEDFVKKMSERMNSLQNKVVVVLGFAFKDQTDDISDSASLHMCELFLKQKAWVRVVDPWVNAEVIRACFSPRYVTPPERLQVLPINQLANVWDGADAVCSLIRTDYFVPSIVPNNMVGMRNPKFFFDFTCNPNYNLLNLSEQGFKVCGFGRQ